jgi:hypothetical protein
MVTKSDPIYTKLFVDIELGAESTLFRNEALLSIR